MFFKNSGILISRSCTLLSGLLGLGIPIPEEAVPKDVPAEGVVVVPYGDVGRAVVPIPKVLAVLAVVAVRLGIV